MENKITKQTSILFNQLWIVKAIEEGNSSFLISQKIPSMSIGEVIEAQYQSINGKPDMPKISSKNSLLYEKEWLSAAEESGITIPKRRVGNYSLAEIIALKHFEREVMSKSESIEKNKIFQIKMGSE